MNKFLNIIKTHRYKMKYILLFIILAILGHGYVLYRYFKDGVVFTGPNDGMEQMLPIQMYLYEHWTSGSFFYATDLGLGGDMFMDLAYYFSTNILFIANVIVIWIISFIFDLNTERITFWTQNAIVLSIIKSFLIMIATYIFSKKIGLNRHASIIAAFLFAVSPIYFRFTVFWPFFSDVFILLPLLLYSIEKFLKEKKIGIFIIVVTITFINNFYFAYYQLLIGLIYFFYRLIFVHKYDIIPRIQQLKIFVIASFLALGNSIFIFFHSARGFIGNNRANYNGEIPLLSEFSKHDNIFYDNYLVVVLFIAIQALLTFNLYKHYYYRLFSIFTIVFIIASFIPIVDSIFNGFSAPQKRWHYLLTFFSSGLIAQYFYYFKSLNVKGYIFTCIPGFIVVLLSYMITKDFVIWIWLMPILFLTGLLIIISHQYKRSLYYLYGVLILLLSFVVSSVHSNQQIYHSDHEKRSNTFFIQASTFDSGLQREYIDNLKKELNDDERIAWRVLNVDNTPMYQQFKGMSLYSSIFDGQLNDYLYNQAKINLQNESLSKYSNMQGRSNLYSLWSTKYLMKKSYQKEKPANFKMIQDDGKYQILENEQLLPSIKITDKYYNQDDITNPLDLEHAMIDGVVTNNTDKKYTKLNKAKNLLNDVTIGEQTAHYQNNNLTIPKHGDGITLQIPTKYINQYEDFYVMMSLKRKPPQSNFTVGINGYENHRLFEDSKYRMHQDNLLYRIKAPKDGKVKINLSKGDYKLKLQGIYGEDYKTLKQANKQKNYQYKEDKGKITINLTKSKKGTLVANIPYREGLKAKVDGQNVNVQRVNHIMAGIEVDKNNKHVEIYYKPPYFKLLIFISIISVILSILFIKHTNRNTKERA